MNLFNRLLGGGENKREEALASLHDEPEPIPAFLTKREPLPVPDAATNAVALALADMTREEPMTKTPAATAAPAEHIATLNIGIDILRETETNLIAEIKARMSELGHVQHAIRSYTQAAMTFAEPEKEPSLDPVVTPLLAAPPIPPEPVKTE